ncbi:MAG: cytochrome P450 [Ilumatobacteraceae bacterium]
MPLAEALTVDDIQLGSLDFWALPLDERDAAFAALRAKCPVAFHPELTVLEGRPEGPGFWSVTRYEDVRTVSRQPHLFSSSQGITTADEAPEARDFFGSMIVLDDPRHSRLRLLVQKGFTPKTVAAIDEAVRIRARKLVAAAADRGECDFVEAFAAPLPLQIICDMLGVPAADEQDVFDWTNVILGAGDPEFGGSFDVLLAAAMAMFNYAQALGQDRLDHPGDDLVSTLMHAEVDGERLSPAEFGSFFILLAVAGNETTRNAISWGMKLLTDHPDQRRTWQDDVAGVTPAAIEEIVRWASPVIHMRRVAMEDTRVGDQNIAAGDKVVMWYWSADRDETVFADGHAFDLARPNAKAQLGYGAGGPHFCLGANLARREITMMFHEIFRWLPDLEITTEPDRLLSPFINGIKRMRCQFTPTTVDRSLA